MSFDDFEVERVEREGLTLRIMQDDDCEFVNPRHNDNLYTMLFDPSVRREWEVGDGDCPYLTELTKVCPACDGERYVDDHPGALSCSYCDGFGDVPLPPSEFADYFGALIALPLRLSMDKYQINSSLHVCSDWKDANGVLLVYQRDVDNVGRPVVSEVHRISDNVTGGSLTPLALDDPRAYKGELQEYEQYLCGEVFGIIVEDENGEEVEDGSCWGFIGLDNVREAGEEMLSYAVEKTRRERAEADYWLARGVETA